MKSKEKPKLTTSRTVEIYREMLSLRRLHAEDSKFFKMDKIWSDLAEVDSDQDEMIFDVKIKTFKSPDTEDYKRKAGVVALDEAAILAVDERLMSNAANGCYFANFMLAHEYSHLALDHHAKSAIVKNYKLFNGSSGMSNIPPTVEELEANIAAVVFQCGPHLLNSKFEPYYLAVRAHSDPRTTKTVCAQFRTDAFSKELEFQENRYLRVVL